MFRSARLAAYSWTGMLGLLQLPCQVHRLGAATNLSDKFSTANLPVLDIVQLPTIRAIEASSAEATRAVRYNSDDPSFPPMYDPKTKRLILVERSVHELGAKALPVESADVIVVGTVTSEEPHVSLDGTMLYTVFEFEPLNVLKGSFPSGASLERIGGVALLPNGSKRMIGETGKGIPEIGPRFLFFLKQEGPQTFSIITGFCVDKEYPIALDAKGDPVEHQRPTSSALIQEVSTSLRRK